MRSPSAKRRHLKLIPELGSRHQRKAKKPRSPLKSSLSVDYSAYSLVPMAAAGSSSATTKANVDDSKPVETAKEQQKPAAALEEDDEFEDFPVEGRYPAEVYKLHEQLVTNYCRRD